eukprot:356275-Chlamydomonas_euryale.AAC.8
MWGWPTLHCVALREHSAWWIISGKRVGAASCPTHLSTALRHQGVSASHLLQRSPRQPSGSGSAELLGDSPLIPHLGAQARAEGARAEETPGCA